MSYKNHVCLLAKSLIISFQYNIERVYVFYSNCEQCFVADGSTYASFNLIVTLF
jgi:hypothetical protein